MTQPDVTLAYRVTEAERVLRETRERQIRTDENVNLLKEGQTQMALEMKEVLGELKSIRDEQKRDNRSVSRWVKTAVILIPVIPTLLHIVGH